MRIDSILAVTDFSAQSAHVLDRAALLARKHRLPLRLTHVVGSPAPFLTDPVARLAQRARQLARRHEIRVHALERSATLHEVLAEAGASSLLVMGPLALRSWKRFFLGTTLDQALRRSECPLLVVKQPPGKPYARVVVAVDLSPHSGRLIDFASRLATPTVLRLFHAIDTLDDARLRSVRASPDVVRNHRLGSRLQARERLEQLMAQVRSQPSAPQNMTLTFNVGHGDPASTAAMHLQIAQAELVVVGQRRSAWLTRWLAPGVAQRLARWAECDVLLAPLDRLPEPMSTTATTCQPPLPYSPASPWGAEVQDA